MKDDFKKLNESLDKRFAEIDAPKAAEGEAASPDSLEALKAELAAA